MKYLFPLLIALFFANTAFANGLEHRNIPDARLLYEDESGKYYGAMMSFRNTHPGDSYIGDVVLRVYAERKANPGGTFFKVLPAKSMAYEGADIKDGSHYAPEEIKRLSQHVFPAIPRIFPEWKRHQNWRGYKDSVYLGLYAEGIYLKAENGDPPRSYEAEDPIVTLIFERSAGGSDWRPAYEGTKFLGDSATVERFTVAKAIERRGQIETNTPNKRSEILAMFARHKAQKASIKSTMPKVFLQILQNERRPGIVYKSGNYWNKYNNFETPRNIIEGNFNFIKHPADFSETYLTYIDEYYKNCKSHLPALRTSYTAEWFETRYGVTSQTSAFYVEMDTRFENKYEAMSDMRHRRNASGVFMSIVKSMAGTEGRSPFAFLGEVVNTVAEDMVSANEMAKFLKDENCTSPIVKQLTDNLWRGSQGMPPIQTTKKVYAGAAAQSQSYKITDAVRNMKESQNALARKGRNSDNNYPYFDEEVVAYRTGIGMANDGRRQVPAMREVGLELQESGYPLLYCYYGPVGFLKNGEYDTYNITFWYEKKPPQLDRLIAAKTASSDLYRGMNYARSSCPANSKKARAIINGG